MMSENCPKMRERLRLYECAIMTNDQDQAAAVRSQTRQQTVRSPLDNRSNAGWELGCDQKDQTTPSVGEEEMDGREDRQQGDDVGR